MTKIIVASHGALPQAEREADKRGLVALVGQSPPRDWDGDPLNTLMGPVGVRLRTVGRMTPKEYARWFDKAYVLDQYDSNPSTARREALQLLSPLTSRPRLVLLGRATAEAFGVWETGCYLHWRWIRWSAVHQGMEVEDDRSQLVAVSPHPFDVDSKVGLFWAALARACRSGRARTN